MSGTLEAEKTPNSDRMPHQEQGAGGQRASKKGGTGSDLSARGEPFLWGMGGALGLGLAMIFGFLLIVAWNGVITFYPRPIQVLTLKDHSLLAGEPVRSEFYKPSRQELEAIDEESRNAILNHKGFAERTLYRIGNFDLYNEDFAWVPAYKVESMAMPAQMLLVERAEWGLFIGTVDRLVIRGESLKPGAVRVDRIREEQSKAAARRASQPRWS